MSNSKVLSLLDLSLWASLGLLVTSFFVYYTAGNETQYNISVVKDDYYRSQTGDMVMVDLRDPISQTDILPLPVKSVSEIIAWTTQVAVQLFTVDFFNIEEQIQDLREFFTDSGWAAMNKALRDDSGWVGSLVEKKLSVSAVLQGSPNVLRHGVLNGAYSWVINFPLLVTYESASERRKETRIFTLTVRRVPADFESGQAGIAIDSFVTGIGSGF